MTIDEKRRTFLLGRLISRLKGRWHADGRHLVLDDTGGSHRADLVLVDGEPDHRSAGTVVDPRRGGWTTAVANPSVVVQLTTDHSLREDRASWHYLKSVPSLQEYVLVSTSERWIESFVRRDPRHEYVGESTEGVDLWSYVSVRRGRARVAGVLVDLAELYADVLP